VAAERGDGSRLRRDRTRSDEGSLGRAVEQVGIGLARGEHGPGVVVGQEVGDAETPEAGELDVDLGLDLTHERVERPPASADRLEEQRPPGAG